MTSIVVLWEDSRSASGDFGPHELLMAMVADAMSVSIWGLKQRVGGKPLRGVDKLLKALKDDDRLAFLAPGGIPVLAVIDGDKVRDHLHMRPDAPSAAVVQRILSSCNQPARLTVVLLERNVESLVEAVRHCDDGYNADLVDRALFKKDLNDRDRLLCRVALDEARRVLRDCIRKRVPSLGGAVEAVRVALAA